MQLNKNFIYLSLFLVLALFIISSCGDETVERRRAVSQQCIGSCYAVSSTYNVNSTNSTSTVYGKCGGPTCRCILPSGNFTNITSTCRFVKLNNTS